jgi:hypothetical protein
MQLGSDQMEIQDAEFKFFRGKVGKTVTDKIKNEIVTKGKSEKL